MLCSAGSDDVKLIKVTGQVEIGMQIGPSSGETSARKSRPPRKRFDHGVLRGI